MRPIFLFLLLFLNIQSLVAQKLAKEVWSDATDYFQHNRYTEALQNFQRYSEMKPDDVNGKLWLGITYYYTNNLTEAKRYLGYVSEQSKNVPKAVTLYQGRIAHAELQFKEAINYYKQYLRQNQDTKDRASLKDDMRRCAFGLKIKTDANVYVQNMGDKINSWGEDFAPVISPLTDDRIYFSSCRLGNLGGLRDEQGLKDEKKGLYDSDIFWAEVQNGEWSSPNRLSNLLNTSRFDKILDISSDGLRMYYFKGFNLFAGETYVDTFKTLEERSFKNYTFNSALKASEGDGTPFFVHDTMMLFSSRRQGGYGGLDLYSSVFSQGKWSAAQNMGSAINSAYDETAPFLANDGRTLYFSCNGLNSIGGFDIFLTEFDDDSETWAKPKNVGIPINSAGDDLDFRLNSDGSKAFFDSNRREGSGGSDIYTAFFKSYRQEQNEIRNPMVFNQVHLFKQEKRAKKNNNSIGERPDEVVYYSFLPISFDKDDDLLNIYGLKSLDQVASILKKSPNAKVNLISHSDETGAAELDIFFSIRRVEKVADYLVKNGVQANQIILTGCGANYPVAQNSLDGTSNIAGKKLNRRVEIRLFKSDPRFKITNESYSVPEYMQSNEYTRFEKTQKSLSYRVQIGAVRQMYSGEVVRLFPDINIEESFDKKIYQYSIGLFPNFAAAEQLRKDMVEKQGISAAYIVPYLNGWRMTEEEIKDNAAIYDDLKLYLAKKKK